MNPKSKELIETLNKLILFLNDADENNWINWAVDSKERIEQTDLTGVDNIIRAYSGMGSFNDLVIYQLNEDVENPDIHIEKTKELSEMKSLIFKLAVQLKQNSE